MVVLAAASAAPRWAAQWMVAVGFALALLAFVLSYRQPAPLLPKWLRDEITEGSVLVARPTRGDWLIFWPFLVLMILGLISVVALSTAMATAPA